MWIFLARISEPKTQFRVQARSPPSLKNEARANPPLRVCAPCCIFSNGRNQFWLSGKRASLAEVGAVRVPYTQRWGLTGEITARGPSRQPLGPMYIYCPGWLFRQIGSWNQCSSWILWIKRPGSKMCISRFHKKSRGGQGRFRPTGMGSS